MQVISTLKMLFAKQPESLRDIKNHVFPAIFNSDKSRFPAMLQELSIDSLLSSLPAFESESEFSFALAALEVGKELGFVQERGMLFTPLVLHSGANR
jgi:hypothetical protein